MSLLTVSVLQSPHLDCGCGFHRAVEGSLQRGDLPGVTPGQLPGFGHSALWHPKMSPLIQTCKHGRSAWLQQQEQLLEKASAISCVLSPSLPGFENRLSCLLAGSQLWDLCAISVPLPSSLKGQQHLFSFCRVGVKSNQLNRGR